VPALSATRAAVLPLVLLCALTTSACGGADRQAAARSADRSDATSRADAPPSGSGSAPGAAPNAPAPTPTGTAADGSDRNGAAPDEAAPDGKPTGAAPARTSPLQLPAGPATTGPPPPPPAPGSLGSIDWSAQRYEGACPDARPGPAVLGDLDGDGRDEAAVPLTCPGAPHDTSSVFVYAGTASRQLFLGDALPPRERGELHALQLREAHLVVTALTRERPDAEPDTAVTTRWVVRDGKLVRTDRWEDPAAVLVVDEDE